MPQLTNRHSPDATQQSRVRIDKQGRIVLPVDLRHALGIEPGAILFAYAERGRLVLEEPRTILARLQERVRAAVPRGVSLVDELLDERRSEAIDADRR